MARLAKAALKLLEVSVRAPTDRLWPRSSRDYQMRMGITT